MIWQLARERKCKKHAPARRKLPHILAASMVPTPFPPGVKPPVGRAIGRQAPFDIRLHVRHQRDDLDANQNAAWANLWHRQIFEAQVATQAVQPACLPSSSPCSLTALRHGILAGQR